MDAFAGLFEAMSLMTDPTLLLFFVLGTLNGMIFGFLPGLSGSVGIALMIPLTYGMGLENALVLFVAAMSGQSFTGSICAILINMPGTAPNAAATFDGYPLTKQGRGGFALAISATASTLGAWIGCVAIVVLFPFVRAAILSFSFPEFTLLGLVGLVAIAMASRGTLLKGLAAGALGILIAMIGFAPIGNQLRYIFGYRPLFDGVDLIPILIGTFAFGEVMRLVLTRQSITEVDSGVAIGRGQIYEGMLYVVKRPLLLLRSAMVGTFIGIVPGVGGTVASFLAYFQAKKTSKDGIFGQGDPRGVLAPEAANDAKDAGSALPSLGFGIPGSSDWAIILGAMIIHGVAPGPTLMTDNPEVVWLTVVAILGASALSSTTGLLAAPLLMRATRVRGTVIGPIVGALAITGAFAVQQQSLDVTYVVIAGVLGYYMAQNQVPVVPLILGLLLGAQVESWYLRTISIFGTPTVFVTRPISLTLVLLLVALIATEVVGWRKRRVTTMRRLDSDEVRVRFNPSGTVLFAFFALLGAGAAIMASGFNEPANQFPQMAGWALFATSGLYVAVATIPSVRDRLWQIAADPSNMTVEKVKEDVAAVQAEVARSGEGVLGRAPDSPAPQLVQGNTEIKRSQELAMVGVLLLTAVGTWIVGLAATLPIFIWVLMRMFGKESIATTVKAVVATLAVLYITFVYFIGVDLTLGWFG